MLLKIKNLNYRNKKMFTPNQKQLQQVTNKNPPHNFNNQQQLSFLKYMELKNYFLPSLNMKNNPLMPLYSLNKNDIILPKSGLTKPENDICIKPYSSIYNKLDNKPVNCVKFFSESKKVLFGTTNGFLTVVDLNNSFNMRWFHILESKPSIRALQFNKDETFVLTGDKNGNITYFRNNNGDNFTKKNIIQLHNDTITDISFSINSTKFVTSSDDKTAKIVDFISGKNELVFKHRSDVKSCEWNPYRNIVVSGGKDQLIEIWDPNSGMTINTLHSHNDSINRIRFNPNGNWILSGSKDHTVKVIDIRIMKELQLCKGHDSEVNTLRWHPEHEDIFCSAGADQKIIYWKVGQEKNFMINNAHDKEIFDLCFNKNGTLLASGSNDFHLKLWMRDNNLF
jgi:polyadenylation factor subunit 2